ncbi:Eco57I restriction-modification methylase domain-containing protein [Actinocorallia sp. A-T 12471]|uniref:Eco57I restriction-modification methylase domain-containing protein n=1 Tax=Actinocorallia sp. A-T 12471 TaxID=3089813 RepID=UPI0029CE357F|nr:DNA methyltransferase [Actinocorallia sp. A-T 12471]MDX6739040.1 DNA methyltransferase [Actinocorallia sp. A-T 12471]
MKRKLSGSSRSSDLHRPWLQLVDTDGPFLSPPILARVWPQGIPQLGSDQAALLREAVPAFENAWEAWDLHRSDQASCDRYEDARDTWVELVLRDVLGWGDHYATDLARTSFAGLAAGVRSPDHRVTVRPTGVLARGELLGALVLVVEPVDSLRDPLNDGWAVSPIDRMEELLRQAGAPIGVVTDGRWWAIVSARKNTMLASGVVDAHLWFEETRARDAFIELLRLRRLLGGRPEDRLTELFGDSVAAAEEVTEALGVQVRRAVELLVKALSEAALDTVRHGDPDPLPEDRGKLYEAAVTVMMRVVFLLFAEERGLLPQSELFTMGYGISGELDRLERREQDERRESLDNTHLTWHRLLSTSLALSQGASFEDLRLPSYGGSLFDPDRFPFLMDRTPRGRLAITVSDLVMLEVLRSVQLAQLRGEPARRISFRDIDVEQIGYIYEGLLGYTSKEVDEVVVGLVGKLGEEPEISLTELEALASKNVEPAAMAEALLAWTKVNQPAASAPSRAALTKAIRDNHLVEDVERALRAATADEGLRDRLRPFIGIIRRDLRNRPFVVEPGGVLLTETPSRANAGAHYTPKDLAEKVVTYSLQPLVFNPGPHQTADHDAWELVSSEDILDLKIADIACGSGAFLVAAARYLAARLVEAWRHERVATGAAHDLYVHAIRLVVARCLYGADINAMAVEMCKLSLWLVSLDPKLPFSFVDDKVLHGNSLLGLTDAEQLRALHITPAKAEAAPLFDLGAGNDAIRHLDIDGVLARASRLRTNLATEVNDDDPQRSATTKRRQWREYQDLTRQLANVADGIIAAGLRLGGKAGKSLTEAYENLRIAVGLAYPADDREPDFAMLDGLVSAGLTPTVATDYARWEPLHWILAVPDVMERGGFDAIIGNPPYLGGQKLTGAMGTNVRDWFVNTIANGRKGSADLVAYFELRTHQLLSPRGYSGLIATNTLAQGDTREVGLDQITESGVEILRAIKSERWPSASAALEYCAVWTSKRPADPSAVRVLDNEPVTGITSSLDRKSRVTGRPFRLVANKGRSYIGSYVLGTGFVMPPEQAQELIERDPRNKDVLFPYLNGEDLNSRPDSSASRWVINFHDWSEERARSYPEVFDIVERLVKPVRATNSRPARRDRWWQYAERAPKLYDAIKDLDRVLVVALVSKTLMPTWTSNRQVLSHKLGIFSVDGDEHLAFMSSSFHSAWAWRNSSTMKADLNYSPSDVYETLPKPHLDSEVSHLGAELYRIRSKAMMERGEGLTKIYNHVHNPHVAEAGIEKIREVHELIDRAIANAYGWQDLDIQHGFYESRQRVFLGLQAPAKSEILDRLLELNHERYKLELAER